MVAMSKVSFMDLSRQRRFEAGLSGDLTPAHTVGQAVDYYLDRMSIDRGGLRWGAFSRGVALDKKRPLSDLPEEDTAWTVLPEVSAG